MYLLYITVYDEFIDVLKMYVRYNLCMIQYNRSTGKEMECATPENKNG